MATEIDIFNSETNLNEQGIINSANNLSNTLNQTNNNVLSISKSREKRMTKLLVVGIILPFSVLLNIQSSEIPAWYNKKTKEPVNFPSYIVNLRTIGQIAGAIATFALLLKSVHIGSSFRILKWRLYKKHRGVIMIIGAIIQCICSVIILIYYYRNYRNYADEYKTSEVGYFTIQSIILSFLSVILLSKDANKRNRIFRQSGLKPKNRLSYMQRQLIVLEITDIFYTVIGGLLFSKLEDWTFNDSVYFSVTTLMTCGSGDYSPDSFIGQFALMVYSIPGILLTTYTVYSIYSVISEILYAKVYKDFSQFINSSNDMYFQNLIKNDITSQSQESPVNSVYNSELPSPSSSSVNNKEKAKAIDNENNNTNSSDKDVSYDINISDHPNPSNRKERHFFESRRSILYNDSNNSIPVQTLRFDPINNNDYESSSDDSYYSDEEHPELERLLTSQSQNSSSGSNVINNYHSIQQPNSSFIRHRHPSYQRQESNNNENYNNNDDIDRPKAFMLARRNTFNLGQNNVQGMKIFSSNQDIDTEQVLKQTRDLNYRQLKLSLSLLILIILFFSLLYSWIENWSFFESIYFCFVNLCTIGYGDFVPKTVYGKSIYIYFMYSAVSSTTWLGTVLLELATGRWEIYIEKTDLEDELYGKDLSEKKAKENKKDEIENQN